MAKPAGLEGCIFIVTYGRSGSTPLQRLVGSIDGVHMTGENYLAIDGLYRSWRAVVKTHDKFGLLHLDDKDPWYGADRLRPARYARKLSDVFMNEVLQPPPGTRRVGFKEIRWFERPKDFVPMLDFMRDLFAPAKFVMNVRDPQEVAGSRWHQKRDAEEVLAACQEAEAQMDAWAAANPGLAFKVNYNAYCADPELLKPLFAFLDAPWQPDTVAAILAERLTH